MEHLVLHVGAPKTGTSLVQKAVIANRELFLKHGYTTLVRHDFDEVTDKLHGRWRRHGLGYGTLDRAVAHLAEATKDAKNLLISHEDLLGPIGAFRQGVLYGEAGAVLERIHEALAPQRTTVLLYVRQQDRYLESVYLQIVRQGGTITFDEFMAQVTPESLRWDDLVDRMAVALPSDAEVKVNYFESIKDRGARDFCRDFVREFAPQVKVKLPFNTSGVNRGWSDQALQIGLAGNAVLQGDDRRRLRRFLDENLSNVTHPKPVLLSDEQRADLLGELRAPNEKLHEYTGRPGTSPYVPAD